MELPVSPGLSQQLIREIQDLHGQYTKEVPKPRGPWPESIKARIRELWSLGMASRDISIATGVPVQTLYSWKYVRKPGFRAVAVIKTKPAKLNVQPSQLENLGAQSQEKPPESKNLAVTVVMPNGVRLEGLDQAAALKFALECMQ